MKLKNRASLHLNGKSPSSPNGYGDGAQTEPPDKPGPATGRDPKSGRFQKGNTAAAGHVNPTARARAELQKALIAAISTEDIAAVARRLRDDALRGSVPSAELLLKYVIGRPAKAEDPDRVALEAWKLIQSWPMLAEFVVAATRGVNPELAADAASLLAVRDPDKLSTRLEDAEDDCDVWGNPFIGKQTDAIIGRRLTKGK